MSLTTELQKIGLSDKEAKVYLATLELAQASVQDIYKKSKVNRATTYVVLESLVEMGLCTTYVKNKKTQYIANNPESIENIFELQKQEIENSKKNFKSILPQLHTITNRQSGKPIVRFFDGKQGIVDAVKLVFEDYKSFDKNEKSLMIYPNDRIKEIITPEDKKKFRNARLDKKIKSKALYTSSVEIPSAPDGERIMISGKDFPITSDIVIYGDNVRIVSLGNKLSSVLIKDKEIANTLKSIFELAWEGAQARKNNK